MSIGSGSAAKMRYAVNKKMPVAIFEMGGGTGTNAWMHECVYNWNTLTLKNIYIRDCTPNFYGQKYQLQGNVSFDSTIFCNIIMISSSTLNATNIYTLWWHFLHT